MMNQLKNFIAYSRKTGKQLDLVQGAGGNTSVKLNQKMMAIKSSGSLLKEMSTKSGFVKVDQKKLTSALTAAAKFSDPVDSENYLHDKLKQSLVGQTKERPSMEAVMHVFLPTHVVHTHSVYANVFNCMVDGESIIKSLFSNDVSIVPYATPGFELALKIRDLAKTNADDYIIFLLNHGVITANRDARAAYSKMIEINEVSKNYILKQLPGWPEFSLSSRIVDDYLKKYSKLSQIAKKCCFPDAVVFCTQPEKPSKITRPIFEALIYIMATIESLGGTLKPLTREKQAILLALNSEKYRQGKKS